MTDVDPNYDAADIQRRIVQSCRHVSSSGSPGVALLIAFANSVPFAPGTEAEKLKHLEAKMHAFLAWVYYWREPPDEWKGQE